MHIFFAIENYSDFAVLTMDVWGFSCHDLEQVVYFKNNYT